MKPSTFQKMFEVELAALERAALTPAELKAYRTLKWVVLTLMLVMGVVAVALGLTDLSATLTPGQCSAMSVLSEGAHPCEVSLPQP